MYLYNKVMFLKKLNESKTIFTYNRENVKSILCKKLKYK